MQVFLIILVVLSCVLRTISAGADGPKPTVLIEGVPHVLQKPDFCGEACAAMFLNKLGYHVDQDYVFDQSGLDPIEGRGCYTRELAVALSKIGFNPGKIYYSVEASNAEQLDALWSALVVDLMKGVPSIVCMHYSDAPKTTEHFRLILGYDLPTGQVIFHDPAVPHGQYIRMPKQAFLKLWPLKYDEDKWTVVRLRLEPRKIQIEERPKGFTRADYAQHIRKLRKKIPQEGFSLVIQEPFVVLGDEGADVLAGHARGTVKWAVDHLKALYFEQEPADILDIWLFKDSESYEKNAVKLFGAKPHTPFGYFSQEHGALVMNIETGGGTLVHEIVHPFMAANFPKCPSWFNEGLASLYEQSAERDGKIVGLTNWRLAGLQESIRKGEVQPFKDLCNTTSVEFYASGGRPNYAQARYLCYYLQENNLLVKYFHAFRKNADNDPGGYKTLQGILETEDMDGFQKKWEKWILGLTFP